MRRAGGLENGKDRRDEESWEVGLYTQYICGGIGNYLVGEEVCNSVNTVEKIWMRDDQPIRPSRHYNE